MAGRNTGPGRRHFLASAFAGSALSLLPAGIGRLNADGLIRRRIPSTGEDIPAIGMGTWITFNVGKSERLRRARLEVLRTFLQLGGGMVDSSPMYGSAQEVMGWCLERLEDSEGLFSATKVWTPYGGDAKSQMAEARALWGLKRFDLMQIHNLVDWEAHLDALRQAKADGHIRYIGITTSHGSRHQKMERIMATEALDFVQFTYNVVDRWAEARLLPLARERGLAVIINRPFQRGSLFSLVEGRPLPAWAKEFDCENWAQFFLKFIISHPGVTCAIPATSQVTHMRENMGALRGRLPEPKMRQHMQRLMADL